MTALNWLTCPIQGCKHSKGGHSQKFNSTTAVIRHLGELSHTTSQGLVDHRICQEVSIYLCSHLSYLDKRKILFATKAEWERHNDAHHPTKTPPLYGAINNYTTPQTQTFPPTTNTFTTTANNNTQLGSGDSALSGLPTLADVCTQLIAAPSISAGIY